MQHRVFIITGVSGSGKTTIGNTLAQRLGIPFFDGDDFHPETNRQKMERGESLTDDDRKPWLRAINHQIRQQLETSSLVFACSALKQDYRDELKKEVPENGLHWVHLQGDYATIHQRMLQRTEHFMPPALLPSQLATYEPPTEGLVIDVAQTLDEIVCQILEQDPVDRG